MRAWGQWYNKKNLFDDSWDNTIGNVWGQWIQQQKVYLMTVETTQQEISEGNEYNKKRLLYDDSWDNTIGNVWGQWIQ